MLIVGVVDHTGDLWSSSTFCKPWPNLANKQFPVGQENSC